MKPKPVNMTLHPLDPFTILVNYTIHSDLDFFPPGFRQQIKFQSEHQSSWTTVKSLLGLEIQFYEFNLTNLIPYSDYKVEVRILSKEVCFLSINVIFIPQLILITLEQQKL